MSQKKKILFADDEDLLRRLVRAMLIQAGYEAMVVEDGLQAMEALRACQGMVDLVILDMTMPRLDGKETFVMIQKEFPGMKVIISSGNDEEEMLEIFQDLKPNAFLEKPFEKEGMLTCVATVLQG